MKALILYTNTGGGHNSAARAAAEALNGLGVSIILVDSLEIAGKRISDRVSKVYNAAVRKSPRIFGMLYNAGKKVSNPNKKSIIYRLNSLYSTKLNEIIEEENPGGSNAMNICGTGIGLICILLDMAKAFIPVYIAINVFKLSGMNLVPITIAPVLGHAFSPFLEFKGGKAVASTYGAFLALYPQSIVAFILAIIMLFYKIVVVIKPDSSASIASFFTVNLALQLTQPDMYIQLIVLIISLVVIWRQLLHPDEGSAGISLFNRFLKVSFVHRRDKFKM